MTDKIDDKPSAAKKSKAVDVKEDRRRSIRITRDLLVNRGPLHVPESIKKPGMVYFWMKDDDEFKFEEYRRKGYEFALDENGKKVRKGRQGEVLYLLDIPVEIHDQLVALKQDIRKERRAEIFDVDSTNASMNKGIYSEKLTRD